MLVVYPCLHQHLESTDNPELRKQVDTFCENRDSDADEFFSRYDGLRAELDNPQDCFDLLFSKVGDTPSEPYFQSILQHLLFIRDDVLIRSVINGSINFLSKISSCLGRPISS